MIIYKQGNILKDLSNLTILAHQTNCRGVMGAGIAKQIARLYPEVNVAQRKMYKDGLQRLGAAQFIKVNDGKLTIANLYAQKGFRSFPWQRLTNYDALRQCLRTLLQHMSDSDRLGMPKIGAGLGGGDWGVIAEIIEDVFRYTTVYVYER